MTTKRKIFELFVVDRQTDKVVETVSVTGDTEQDAIARAGTTLKTDIADRKFTVIATEIGEYTPQEVTLVKDA